MDAFDNETGADELRDAMVRLQKEHVVKLEDAAVVVRKACAPSSRVTRLSSC
jgi:uncharacterized membrane protein